MKIINLHGKIGKEFGKRWTLEVDSIAEALRAIDANTGRFFKYLTENQQEYKTFSFILNGCSQQVEREEELLTPLPKKCDEIDIVPNAEGALATFLISLVVSLATGFITRALFKPPKKEEEKQTKSFLFSGAENVAQQGLPVPLGYGRLLVGSVIVSATMRHINRNRVDNVVSGIIDDSGLRKYIVEVLREMNNIAKYKENEQNVNLVDRADPEGAFALGTSEGG